ncbi:MAG: DUF2249 domain-containing protein [Thermodesulfobacteriota bacterium]
MESILDVRPLVPKERHAGIFNTFKELAPGDSFILVNDHDPRPLLYQFQSEHRGEFEWWPLERGPEAWRVMIVKRQTKAVERDVTDYMQEDHRRLDKILETFQKAREGGEWEKALGAFLEFDLGLRRHIQAEEEVLFPLFEEKTGMTDGGPTFVMRMEHTDIKDTLQRILTATVAKDGEAAAGATEMLINTLTDHNMKEEHILYPESDSFFSEAERQDFINKAQVL